MGILKTLNPANSRRVLAGGAATLLLAACSSGGAETEPVEQSTPSESSQSDSSEEEIEEVQAASGGPDCLIGTWEADNQFFIEQFKELGTAPSDVSGEILLTFGADGTMSTDYRDMSFTFASEGDETSLVRTGVDTGTYTAGDSTISMEGTQTDSVMTMTMLGTENIMEGVPWDAVDWNYTCIGDQATITGPDSAVLLVRKG